MCYDSSLLLLVDGQCFSDAPSKACGGVGGCVHYLCITKKNYSAFEINPDLSVAWFCVPRMYIYRADIWL